MPKFSTMPITRMWKELKKVPIEVENLVLVDARPGLRTVYEGDCTVRAYTHITGLPYGTVRSYFNRLANVDRPLRRKKRYANTPSKTIDRVATSAGLTTIDTRLAAFGGDGTRPTAKRFAREHPTGRYILHSRQHTVACIDGMLYDAWDSRNVRIRRFEKIADWHLEALISLIGNDRDPVENLPTLPAGRL